MMSEGRACCSSPTAICYWCIMSLLAWGVLSVIGIYWYPLHASGAATFCLAVAIGCTTNWIKNRTLHCAITGPVFLGAGFLFLLSDSGRFAINPHWVWLIVAALTALAFLLEWRCGARTPGSSGRSNS
jgi:hypothetical protein